MIHVTGFTAAAAASPYSDAVSAAIENNRTPPMIPAATFAAVECGPATTWPTANQPTRACT
jgi:hypothetical protein